MPVVRVSIRDQILYALTNRILNGQYQPGDRLIELHIAKEFGASQGSVREALRELEASWLVESEPNRGTRVRVVSRREMREAYLCRGVLEQAAASGAAKVFKGRVEPLRAEVAELLQAAVDGSVADQAAHVYAFHHQVVAASGNGVLLRLWESLVFDIRVRIRLHGRNRLGEGRGVVRAHRRGVGARRRSSGWPLAEKTRRDVCPHGDGKRNSASRR